MALYPQKRFWKTADVTQANGGFGISLDGRVVKTPAKSPLVVPSMALVRAIAGEWNAQDGTIDPATMPMTRRANAAIDKVTPQRAEVAAMLSQFGGTDLLCYRARDPAALAERQAKAWDPLLDWAGEKYGARLRVTTGVVPIAQPLDALERLARAVHALAPFALTGFHDLVTASGSLVIGLAALCGAFPTGELWELSRLDEIWQEEQWGQDDDATRSAIRRETDFRESVRFVSLLE
ncbi:MAG: ATP12 family chaperone protein [Paracoccaceae bacterium]